MATVVLMLCTNLRAHTPFGLRGPLLPAVHPHPTHAIQRMPSNTTPITCKFSLESAAGWIHTQGSRTAATLPTRLHSDYRHRGASVSNFILTGEKRNRTRAYGRTGGLHEVGNTNQTGSPGLRECASKETNLPTFTPRHNIDKGHVRPTTPRGCEWSPRWEGGSSGVLRRRCGSGPEHRQGRRQSARHPRLRRRFGMDKKYSMTDEGDDMRNGEQSFEYTSILGIQASRDYHSNDAVAVHHGQLEKTTQYGNHGDYRTSANAPTSHGTHIPTTSTTPNMPIMPIIRVTLKHTFLALSATFATVKPRASKAFWYGADRPKVVRPTCPCAYCGHRGGVATTAARRKQGQQTSGVK